MLISNLDDLKKKLREIEKPVVGVAISAFVRIGMDEYLNDFRIVCMKNTRDMEILGKDFEILSLESLKNRKRTRRNTLSILRDKATEDFLSGLEDPHLIIYRPTERVEKLCAKKGWRMMGNSPDVYTDNKVEFRRILESLDVPVIPGEIRKAKTLDYEDISGKYGKKFVIQMQEESGGKGTFFVSNEKDLGECRNRITEREGNSEVLVTKFIPGPSPSLTGCVTRHGILYTGLQHQLLDVGEVLGENAGSGVFCGHDWTASDGFDEKINEQACVYAEKIGGHLRSRGYKGIFGLDMIIEGDRLYVVELNPRILGSFPALSMVQKLNGEPVIMGFHLLEFMEEDYNVDVRRINNQMKMPKKGAQLVLFNKTRGHARNRKSMPPGVYTMEGDSLKYLRPGYSMEHIRKKGEFILADGVPLQNTMLRPGERLMKLLTLETIIEGKGIRGWVKSAVRQIYDRLDIVPEEWGDVEENYYEAH